MKKILIIILSLICFNLFGCSVIATTNNNGNKKDCSIDTTTVDEIATNITTTTKEEITTTTQEESKVYDLIKDLNKYDLKEGDIFYNEDLKYYICDKKTGDVVESYRILYRTKNSRLNIQFSTIYSLYEYNSELEKFIFKDEFYYNVWIDEYERIQTYKRLNKDKDNYRYSICLNYKNKYEVFDESKLLHCFPDNNLALLELIIYDDLETFLYLNDKLCSDINYESITIKETKDKIIVRYKELNNRLIYKEYNTNDYYFDIVNIIENEPYIFFNW